MSRRPPILRRGVPGKLTGVSSFTQKGAVHRDVVSPSKTEPSPSQAGGFAAARSMFKSPSKKSSQAQRSRSQSSQSPQGGPSQQPVTPSPNKRPAISASPSSQSSSNNPAPKRLRGSSVTNVTSPVIAGSPVSPLISIDSDKMITIKKVK
ncbi:hypothetical protein EDB80DRAFT_693020 [Ilyonectria destructans]|nr:hypothetical protein EDB80DRAFT_693020 [Ilyonectria destructans]